MIHFSLANSLNRRFNVIPAFPTTSGSEEVLDVIMVCHRPLPLKVANQNLIIDGNTKRSALYNLTNLRWEITRKITSFLDQVIYCIKNFLILPSNFPTITNVWSCHFFEL
jgi:hypothetical protein